MEYFDVVDENNNLTGEKEERNIIHEKGIWHREVAVWVIDEKGEMLLQKRAATKKQLPNKWALCEGHIDAGESMETAAIRELEEELGLKTTINDLEFISMEKKPMVLPNSQINNNFQYIYIVKTNMKIEEYKIQLEELSEIKYISLDELVQIVENKDPEVIFSNNEYMPKILDEIKKRI